MLTEEGGEGCPEADAVDLELPMAWVKWLHAAVDEDVVDSQVAPQSPSLVHKHDASAQDS